jgi:hypothetical protein
LVEAISVAAAPSDGASVSVAKIGSSEALDNEGFIPPLDRLDFRPSGDDGEIVTVDDAEKQQRRDEVVDIDELAVDDDGYKSIVYLSILALMLICRLVELFYARQEQANVSVASVKELCAMVKLCAVSTLSSALNMGARPDQLDESGGANLFESCRQAPHVLIILQVWAPATMQRYVKMKLFL